MVVGGRWHLRLGRGIPVPGDVAAAREKVQRYLGENFDVVDTDSDENFSVRRGSSRIFVKVRTHDDTDWTWVTLEVPLLSKVDETPEVFEYVALHSDDFVFGHLSAVRAENGLLIFFSHALLGDYLDETELVNAVDGMLTIADNMDDELGEMFGGDRFHGD